MKAKESQKTPPPHIAISDFSALENNLEYNFEDRSLLERAITHRSFAHEQVGPNGEPEARRLHNEAFEFLGDSVLGLIVADYLFGKHPEASEGELSRMKHGLVSTATLAHAAARLGLGDFLRFGRGEEKTGGRRKKALLADSFEAVLAAIYLDKGLNAATEFVNRALAHELECSDPQAAAEADHKTTLQECLQAKGLTAPQYNVIETAGPPHKRTFHVEAVWNGGSVRGKGRSIKAAETEAARIALEQIRRTAPESGAQP
jgi:ribonuclease III